MYGFDHPDLVEVERRLRRHYEAVLTAEVAAAAAYSRRVTTLRDRLVDIEGSGVAVTVRTADGRSSSGTVAGVCADHVELADGTGRRLVVASAIVSVELS